MAGMSPTQLTLRNLRERGYRAAVVERWNPFARIRQDLFGCVDVIGVGPEGTIGVQSTSDSNMSKRVLKFSDADAIGDLRDANWTLEVHGWKKVKNRWQVRVEDIS